MEKYKKQLVPSFNEKGEKVVWVNCFCGSGVKNWRREIVHVMDGGSCYFNLSVNLTLRTTSPVDVNGVG